MDKFCVYAGIVFDFDERRDSMSDDALDELFEGRGRVLRVPEVAELLGMTPDGVRKWIADGTVRAYQLGNTWFILQADLRGALRAGVNRDRSEN